MATAKKTEEAAEVVEAPAAPAAVVAGSVEADAIRASQVQPLVGAGTPEAQSAEELAHRFDGVAPSNVKPHKFPTKQ
ncbi:MULTISPECIES: hypothetical protein [Mycobacteroides]|jgi:hypothetical protein|uniref:hypothetical protein n=1 Tax=Mycobacteroides TaxID=670516 RepID=UPI00092BAB3B|nr:MULTISPECIES: hypothetical protein [Mycobacteroides]MBV6360497.1 hypothetical protein [Mycobacteroides chelonae]SHW94767.1 Uncharacterised protein [Mycobacteroides abscessus subsp. abscessus]SKL78390.1 Uncharacterised protein [Mycobacteroides abscessus subsp. abscessus]SKM54481.1 Uncharacterised protein [Mycobacteroides abscessus subsp. abscessus]SLK35308.1 Uncharacterised protein [Mycobacteroides abscessus subsp. abscessus]